MTYEDLQRSEDRRFVAGCFLLIAPLLLIPFITYDNMYEDCELIEVVNNKREKTTHLMYDCPEEEIKQGGYKPIEKR